MAHGRLGRSALDATRATSIGLVLFPVKEKLGGPVQQEENRQEKMVDVGCQVDLTIGTCRSERSQNFKQGKLWQNFC